MEDDIEISLFLGPPFLATAKALIVVHAGKITLKVEAEEVILGSLKP